jgi:hypothetical protein
MADWYYAKNGQQQGPVSSADLKRLVAAGELGPTDLVFQEGGTQWVEANTIKGLFPSGGVSSKPSAPAPAPRRDDPEPAPRGRRGRDDDVGELPSDDDYPRPRRSGSGGERGGFMDLLMFRVFIAPWLIIISFWILTGLILILGFIGVIMALFAMMQSALGGLLTLVMVFIGTPMAILYVRIICETAIIFFRQYDAIVDVRTELEKQRTGRGD